MLIAESGNSKRLFWRILLYVSVAAAVVPAAIEATAFVHDRVVVHQDFACLERYLASVGRRPEESDMYDTYAACHIVTRKPYGHESSRAWRSGFPMLWLSMDESWVRTQTLAGLPFLVTTSILAIMRRATERASKWALLVACWLLLLGCLAAIQRPPNLDRLRVEAPSELETVVMIWWWWIRVTSFAWLAAVTTLASVTLRKQPK